jgi:hypothetical protein
VADAVTKPRRTTAYGGRFVIAYAIVAIVFGGVIALFAFLVSQKETPQWSAYQPKGKGIERAQNIANHVGPRYREGGQTIVAVDAQPPVVESTLVDAFALARAPSSRVGGGIQKLESAEGAVVYVFCGLGRQCTIPGEPSPERALLLKRESLELALYTFKYMDDVKSVVTLLPPVGNTNTAGYFKRSHVSGLLEKPLYKTLPAQGPFDTQGDAIYDDAQKAEQLTAGRFFQSAFQQLPNGRALLVLTRPAG